MPKIDLYLLQKPEETQFYDYYLNRSLGTAPINNFMVNPW